MLSRSAGHLVKLPDRREEDCLRPYRLGLLGPGEAVAIAGWIARAAEAAGLYARIRVALAPLESLPPEPCPEESAERTVQLLWAAARESRVPERTKTTRRRSLNQNSSQEDWWLCLSSNILMK